MADTPTSLDQKKTDVVSGTSEKNKTNEQLKKADAINVATNLSDTRTPTSDDMKPTDKVKNTPNILDADIKVFEAHLAKDPSYLKTNLSSIMQGISSYKVTWTENLVTIQNTYAETIANLITKSTDTKLVSDYLAFLTPSTLIYLGADTQHQKKNITLLMNSEVWKSLPEDSKKTLVTLLYGINKAPTKGNEIKKFDKEALKQDIQKSFDEVIDQFWSILTTIFELFGGKWAVENFFHALNITYPPSFKEKINTLYKGLYTFSLGQKTALESVYASKDTFATTDTPPKCDQKAVVGYYQTWWTVDENFKLLDPILVQRAMKKLNIPTTDVITEVGKSYWEMQYKINTVPSQKANIVAKILEDPSIWSSVAALWGSDVASTIYGKKNPETANWLPKNPKNPKDAAVAFGAYLMKWSRDLKYAISENIMPYESNNKVPENLTPETPETTKIKTEWTSFFTITDSAAWKDYPLSDAAVQKLSPADQTKYVADKKTISDRITTLLNPNNKDFSVLSTDPIIKDKLSPFLAKYISVYLYNLSKDPTVYTQINKPKIETLITTFKTMTPGFSIELWTTGFSIKWKDWSTPPQNVEIKTSEFTWLPTLASSVPVVTKTPVKAKAKK